MKISPHMSCSIVYLNFIPGINSFPWVRRFFRQPYKNPRIAVIILYRVDNPDNDIAELFSRIQNHAHSANRLQQTIFNHEFTGTYLFPA